MAKIEIYTTPFCGFCMRAKSLLKKKKLAFEEKDVFVHANARHEMMERSNGYRTVPQIFIDNKFIGGCDELFALDRQGGLDPLLAG